MKQIPFEELDANQKNLISAAEKVMENSYNPYSHFFVGAALLTDDGKIVISGTNVENAAYGSSICAERSALLRANAMGYRTFKSIGIITRGDGFDAKEPSAPCGSCRQMLVEVSQLAGKDLEIILSSTKKDKIILTSIDELLPLAFGPRDVGVYIAKYKK